MSRWLIDRVGPTEKLAHALYHVYGYNAEVALKWLLEGTGRVPSADTSTGRRSSSGAKAAVGCADSARPR